MVGVIKQKGFTLIELLVVVAIIGILAAVGVVAYNGYTGAAKVNAVKANHKLAVKIISQELMRCEVEDKIRYWSPATKQCEETSCRWTNPFLSNFSKISSCLDGGDTFKTNPFNHADRAYHHTSSVPTAAEVGRTQCGPYSGRVICYSRWGKGANDYDTIEINDPF